jgi:hypothetical protein
MSGMWYGKSWPWPLLPVYCSAEKTVPDSA